MQRKCCRLFAAAFLLSFCGYTTQTEHVSPEDALFCENLADQAQSVDQLHIATETTEPAATEDSDTTSAIYAMWFLVMDYADTLHGKTANEFRTIMRQRLQNAADLGINTVYFHVRAYQDAYYTSELFLMGAYADPDIDFDPLCHFAGRGTRAASFGARLDQSTARPGNEGNGGNGQSLFTAPVV